jgi:hypothetical protein
MQACLFHAKQAVRAAVVCLNDATAHAPDVAAHGLTLVLCCHSQPHHTCGHDDDKVRGVL